MDKIEKIYKFYKSLKVEVGVCTGSISLFIFWSFQLKNDILTLEKVTFFLEKNHKKSPETILSKYNEIP